MSKGHRIWLAAAAIGAVAWSAQAQPEAGEAARSAIPTQFPAIPEAPEGAPNILLVLTDDVGFGSASAFGGPVPTPNLERLAGEGLTYNRFHTTAMCSPTRAALLTGRNHHAVGMGALTDFPMGAPGYTGQIPKSAQTIAEVLRQSGYNTAMFGKHHNVPNGPFAGAGPLDYMPNHMGFEYFWGFVGSDTDQWYPSLFRNGARLIDEHPAKIFDERMADEAIGWLHAQQGIAPDKPFFVYYAPGSAHTPHQAPEAWLQRFRGQFDQGWGVVREQTLARQKAMGLVPADTQLPEWPAELPHWEDLPPQEKQFQARQMEAFAAQLSFQDAQFGRLLDELERMGIRDDTLIVFIEGDNGPDAAASPNGVLAEGGEISNRRLTREEHWQLIDTIGGPLASSNYGAGWAQAMATPFPYYKSIGSHLGGTRNGMVVSWPDGIAGRGLRTHYSHLIDIYPTLLDAAGVPTPEVVAGFEQQEVDGASMVGTFASPVAPEYREVQYYEMLGNRAIYANGWLASTVPQRLPWNMASGPRSAINDARDYRWQLFDLTRDFNQTNDLSQQYPERLAQMQELFAQQAERYEVNPISDRTDWDRIGAAKAFYGGARDRYEYYGGPLMIPLEAAPSLAARAFTITAQLTGGDGVIAATGSVRGGWSFYLEDGIPKVRHALTLLPSDQMTIASSRAIAPGQAAEVIFDLDYDGGGPRKGGTMRIFIDGEQVASGRIPMVVLSSDPHTESFDIGIDSGLFVVPTEGTSRFTGTLEKVSFDLGPPGRKRGQ